LRNKIIISYTSCLIALDRINQLIILHQLFSVVLTTREVETEFGSLLSEWIIVQPIKNLKKKKELKEIADEGEASAIALETDNCILIIDEKKGRKLAQKLKIEIIGTLQILLTAK
jgi:predicted nucleic acid-binding protein